ncbi:MAG: apolipoprotein N-acyltransferase [Alcanivoracaceae bacterium]|jgi:apolipoprotein N-acyltransferase|nr:apolipoprotein N-acyltransferase [Alcanivoracaceae bacterium]
MDKLLFSLIAGLLYPLAFAPWGWWPLVLVSIALFWWSLNNASPRQAALRGWLFGLGSFGFGVSWLHVSMHQYGDTPLWLAVPMTGLFAAAMALYPALLAGLSARLGQRSIVFVGLWLLIDWLRGLLLTGFPWLYPGYAMTDTPLSALAPLGGIWLVSLITVAAAVSLAELARRRWHSAIPTAVLTLVGALVSLLPLSFTEQTGDPVKVALAQGNVPQDVRWQLTQQAATRAIYADLTGRASPGSLLIWPEAAITEFYQDARPFLLEQGERMNSRGGALITGIPWREYASTGPQYFNSVTVLGGGQGLYHKQKLVPFGEYVPFQEQIRGLIPFFDLPMSSFSRGHAEQPNLTALGLTVSPFICYEILYPSLVAKRSQDSDLLLTISNDAWFGTSAGPHQHFQMTRMRALETGRWLLRGTNNGITALIAPNGKVHARLAQFERGLLEGEVRAVTGTTPFMLTGPSPTLLLAMALVALGRIRRHP